MSDEYFIVTLDKWGEVDQIIEGPMDIFDDITRAFDNLKNAGRNGNALSDAFKGLFDEAMLMLAKSSLTPSEKIGFVMDMRRYFDGLITAG